PDGRNAFLGAFAGARAERISSDIDVVIAAIVLIREPCHIARFHDALHANDALHRGVGRLPAKQKCNRLIGSEATAQETNGDFIHRNTSWERESCGHLAVEKPSFHRASRMTARAYAATSSSEISSNSSSPATRSARSSLRMEVTR